MTGGNCGTQGDDAVDDDEPPSAREKRNRPQAA